MKQIQKLLQKKEKPEFEVADSDFTCQICMETIRANNRPTISKCKHDFCFDCIAKYIESKVGSNIANINCPTLECKLPLDPLSCRPVISNHLFNKWCDLLCKATVRHHYANRIVYCPYPYCSALIVNECKDNVRKFTCPNCRKKFCFLCKRPWHAGYRCSENGLFRDKNDVLFGELIEEKKWTRCPFCGNAVERNGGCEAIHCRCGMIFCHACGEVRGAVCGCGQVRPDDHRTDYVAVIIILSLVFIVVSVGILTGE